MQWPFCGGTSRGHAAALSCPTAPLLAACILRARPTWFNVLSSPPPIKAAFRTFMNANFVRTQRFTGRLLVLTIFNSWLRINTWTPLESFPMRCWQLWKCLELPHWHSKMRLEEVKLSISVPNRRRGTTPKPFFLERQYEDKIITEVLFPVFGESNQNFFKNLFPFQICVAVGVKSYDPNIPLFQRLAFSCCLLPCVKAFWVGPEPHRTFYFIDCLDIVIDREAH